MAQDCTLDVQSVVSTALTGQSAGSDLSTWRESWLLAIGVQDVSKGMDFFKKCCPKSYHATLRKSLTDRVEQYQIS